MNSNLYIYLFLYMCLVFSFPQLFFIVLVVFVSSLTDSSWTIYWFVFVHDFKYALSVCMHACMSVCMYGCMHVWTHGFMNAFFRTHISTSNMVNVGVGCSTFLNLNLGFHHHGGCPMARCQEAPNLGVGALYCAKDRRPCPPSLARHGCGM